MKEMKFDYVRMQSSVQSGFMNALAGATFFFQAEDGIRDHCVTGVQTCALPIFEAGKPVAAICHGPQVLISANLLRGRMMTSWPAIKVDMRNAGANWVDQEVIVDNGLVSSRKPDDIPAFNKRMVEEFAEGRHAKQAQMAGAELET